MAWKNLIVGFTLGAAAAVGAGFAVSHTASPSSTQDPMGQDAAMQAEQDAWMATMMPGPEHEWIAKGAGKWNVTMKMWMEGPDSAPIVSNGTSECKMVLDGRYLVEHFNGTMNLPPEMGGAMPFEGMGMTGYDRVRNAYVSTWVDSMSTQLMTMKGSRSPETGVLNMYGEMDDVAMGVYGKYVRSEVKWIDENTHIMSMYDLHAGPDFKVFELTYKRAK